MQVKFDSVYEEYFQKVYSLAYRMTGSTEEAADIAQEAFTRAYENLDGFRGESRITTWIYAIARNICLQHLKNEKRRSFRFFEELIEKAGSAPNEKKREESEWNGYVRQVKDGCLLGLLRCLSIHQRLAFVLHILIGLPIGDVAAIIGKSPNSARILAFRARRNLRAFLCKNCSLYDRRNPCKCENLIGFSLKQGWIKKKEHAGLSETIENEIREFKDEISLYRSLPSDSGPSDWKREIAARIKNNDKGLFLKEKVK